MPVAGAAWRCWRRHWGRRPASCGACSSFTLAAAVDFSALPALTAADLEVEGELEGAGSLAAAASLARLDVCAVELGAPPAAWVAEVLRCAPPSLRQLTLEVSNGTWSAEHAAALGELRQLQALALILPAGAALPREGAPLWSSLRGLEYWGGEQTPLHQVRQLGPCSWGTL